jgi:hypothetical protein
MRLGPRNNEARAAIHRHLMEIAEGTKGTMAKDQRIMVEAPTVEALSAIFTALRAILRIFQEEFVVKADKPNHCRLETRSPSLNGRRLFFAAAKVKKNYVSYYLPALYMFPKLADRISPGPREITGAILF